MKIEQSFAIAAPIQSVWDFFLDAQGVSACIPGCLGVEVLGPDSYRAKVMIAMGPIKTTFNMAVSIIERDAPHRLVTVTKGEEGSKSSTLQANSSLILSRVDDQNTEVLYSSDVSLLGRLGTYGLGVMKKRVAVLGEEFAAAVRNRLEATIG